MTDFLSTDGPEVYRPIPGFSKYQISNWGNLKLQNGRVSNITAARTGYISTTITDDSGKTRSVRLNVLVASAFLPNSDPNKTQVDHGDKDRGNNRLSNLKWVTPSENCTLRNADGSAGKSGRMVAQYDLETNQKIATWRTAKEAAASLPVGNRRSLAKACQEKNPYKGYRWLYLDELAKPEAEVWTEINIDGRMVPVSSHGRVKTLKGITYGCLRDDGYKIVGITTDNGRQGILVHRLVAMAFEPIPNPELYEVNHIDDDPSNNSIDNLEWLTHQENMIHAQQFKISTFCKKKPIEQITETGEIIASYESIADGVRASGLWQSDVQRVCDGTKKAARDGTFWRYAIKTA